MAIAYHDIDKHLDAVLRASGSALRHYTMQKTLDDMRMAMAQAIFSAMTAAQIFDDERSACFAYTLKAGGGYRSSGESRISPKQYGAIRAILHTSRE
ncbi:MAG: hypothetical protein ACRYGK_01605 [Janthinobacterium lividum]